MLFAGPVLLQAFTMNLCSVAFVPGELVVWIETIHLYHDAISRGLGDDRRGTNCRNSGIATDDGLTFESVIIKSQIRQSITVNLNAIWRSRQA
jgi:hypothetical protein